MTAVVTALRAGLTPETLCSMVEAASLALRLTAEETGGEQATPSQAGPPLLLLPAPETATPGAVAQRGNTHDAEAPGPASRGQSRAEPATLPDKGNKPEHGDDDDDDGKDGGTAAAAELDERAGDGSGVSTPDRASARRGENAVANQPGPGNSGRISLRIKLKHNSQPDSPALSNVPGPTQGCPSTVRYVINFRLSALADILQFGRGGGHG